MRVFPNQNIHSSIHTLLHSLNHSLIFFCYSFILLYAYKCIHHSHVYLLIYAHIVYIMLMDNEGVCGTYMFFTDHYVVRNFHLVIMITMKGGSRAILISLNCKSFQTKRQTAAHTLTE